MTPLLHLSSPSLPIYKENVEQLHQVSKQPVIQQDELPSHHSSEENVSSDDWMSDYSPPWSSEKEDLEEEDDKDEDGTDVDADSDDSDSEDSDFDSNFDSPPPKRARLN